MASHENVEEWLDYGSGRYKLIGRPDRDDSYLHAGAWVDMRTGMQWMAIQVLADEWGRWYFLDAEGSRISGEVV